MDLLGIILIIAFYVLAGYIFIYKDIYKVKERQQKIDKLLSDYSKGLHSLDDTLGCIRVLLEDISNKLSK